LPRIIRICTDGSAAEFAENADFEDHFFATFAKSAGKLFFVIFGQKPINKKLPIVAGSLKHIDNQFFK
jgi:hypothetical protein